MWQTKVKLPAFPEAYQGDRHNGNDNECDTAVV